MVDGPNPVRTRSGPEFCLSIDEGVVKLRQLSSTCQQRAAVRYRERNRLIAIDQNMHATLTMRVLDTEPLDAVPREHPAPQPPIDHETFR